MKQRSLIGVVMALATLAAFASTANACCPLARDGQFAVNADQTVAIVWNPATRTQHFIRQASFKTDADDVGFVVPSPTVPTLSESGDAGFDLLAQITAPPPPAPRPWYGGLGCATTGAVAAKSVTVVSEKRIAGFNTVVIKADSPEALDAWLAERQYLRSPQVADWARPYVDGGWYFVAMKLAPRNSSAPDTGLRTPALRISFATDRPLFPYREPVYPAEVQRRTDRILNLYFLSDTRYQGVVGGTAWSGHPVFDGRLDPKTRSNVAAAFALPENALPADVHLIQFVDRWPYTPATGDLYFSPATTGLTTSQAPPRPAGDLSGLFLAALAMLPLGRWFKNVWS